MLTIKFEMESNVIEEEIDSFSRGHITIRGKGNTLSSKDRIPDQSMMIFFAISQLLSEVKMFMTNKDSQKYNFVGTDSSFQFLLIKKEKYLLLTDIKDDLIYKDLQSKMIEFIWKGVKDFIVKFACYLEHDGIIKNDLHISLEEFREEFNLFKLDLEPSKEN